MDSVQQLTAQKANARRQLSRADVAARRAARAALRAAQAPPLPTEPPIAAEPMVATTRAVLPVIEGQAKQPFVPSEDVDHSSNWLRRNTSFAISMVVHLLLLIGLAVWTVNGPAKPTQVVLSSTPIDTAPEAFVEMLAPAEPVPEMDELMSELAGDMTDLPEGAEPSLEDWNNDSDVAGSLDFSRDVVAQGELMQQVGGTSGTGDGGGGTGGLGSGIEVGNMMEFVERLQRAGAKTGDVQISLLWDNFNDLDLHVLTPRGETIFFGHRRSRCRGELDVDMNAGFANTREPIENVYWGKGKAPFGKFKVAVHHYHNHGDPDPTPFELRVIVDGKTQIVKGEISFGSPRLIMYEFERKRGVGPASVASPSPNEAVSTSRRSQKSPANILEND